MTPDQTKDIELAKEFVYELTARAARYAEQNMIALSEGDTKRVQAISRLIATVENMTTENERLRKLMVDYPPEMFNIKGTR